MNYRLAITLLVGLAILISSALLVQTLPAQTKEETNESTQETVTSSSEYPGIDISTEITEQDTFKMAIHSPKVSYSSVNATFQEFIDAEKKAFRDELQQNLEFIPSPHWQSELYITFQTYQLTDTLYSFSFAVESNLAGANGNQKTKAFMIDLASGKLLTLEDLLVTTPEASQQLTEDVFKTLRTTEAYKDYLFKETFQEVEKTIFERGFVTQEGIGFKFNKYEVAAGAAGMPEVLVPLPETLVKDSWKESLTFMPNEEDEEVADAEPIEDPVEKQQPEPSRPEKKVALTFDDGPHPENTPAILQLLHDYNMKGTFFMLGSRIEYYPEIVKTIREQGHEIGNHTWNHKQLPSLSEANMKEEITSVDTLLESVIGEKASVFRPPYGATNDLVESVAGAPTVLWTIDTLDWKSHDPKAILASVENNLHPNAIILMHDIHTATVEGVELVLTYLQEQGYTSVPVSEVLGEE